MPVPSTSSPTPFRRIALFVPVLAWCTAIYVASDQPNLRVSSDDLVDLVLRKAAHVLVFGVLATLLVRALRPERLTHAATLAVAWLATLGYAVLDEWHQSFVHGRVGHATDVVIDMVGASAAIILLHRRRRHRPRTLEESTP